MCDDCIVYGGADAVLAARSVNTISHTVHAWCPQRTAVRSSTNKSPVPLANSMMQKTLMNFGHIRSVDSLYSPLGGRKYVNADERARFLNAARDVDAFTRTLCMTLVYTGCRLSEALSLTVMSIQPRNNVISVRSLKKRHTGVVREIPVPDCLIDVLDDVHGVQKAQHAAVVDLSIPHLWSWQRTWAWMRVKSVMQRAEIVGLQATPKGLRHGYGVHAVLSGVPLNMLQKWMGHEHMATTAIYANVVGPEEHAIARRMWQSLG